MQKSREPNKSQKHILRNLIIEVYGKKFDKKSLLAFGLDEVRKFLGSIISDTEINSVVSMLEHQQADPKMFPNAVIFLNEFNEIISINKFMNKDK